MAVSNIPIYPQTVQTWAQQILPADTTTKKTLVTAGTNGSIVESIGLTNTDAAAAYAIQFFVNNGTFDALIATVNVPLSAGNVTAVAAVDFLRNGASPICVTDANGNLTIVLKAGYVLKISSTTTVTAAKEVDVVAMGADY